MPKLIRDGAITEDHWLPADGDQPGPNNIPTLAQWREDAAGAVQLEPGDGVTDLLPALDSLQLVAINFPVFTDGRGFSYARELRQRGYRGEIRALGNFLRDQMTYLSRCGFNAFQSQSDSELQEALDSLDDFSVHYQGSANQPEPLFRRRA